MIQFEQGCVHNKEHLKLFDMELAKAGHPLATKDGDSVRCLRQSNPDGDFVVFAFDEWTGDYWSHEQDYGTRLELRLHLAPLAVKNNRALHVGDEIELCIPEKRSPQDEWAIEWRKHVASLGSLPTVLQGWRWPKE